MMFDILRQVAPSVHGDHATHGSFEAFFILGANIAKKTGFIRQSDEELLNISWFSPALDFAAWLVQELFMSPF